MSLPQVGPTREAASSLDYLGHFSSLRPNRRWVLPGTAVFSEGRPHPAVRPTLSAAQVFLGLGTKPPQLPDGPRAHPSPGWGGQLAPRPSQRLPIRLQSFWQIPPVLLYHGLSHRRPLCSCVLAPNCVARAGTKRQSGPAGDAQASLRAPPSRVSPSSARAGCAGLARSRVGTPCSDGSSGARLGEPVGCWGTEKAPRSGVSALLPLEARPNCRAAWFARLKLRPEG